MEIEILTTKKKLSKNIIKQLNPAKIYDITYFNSVKSNGYYVRDLGAKYPPVVLLFESITGWRIIDCRGWKPVSDTPRLEASAKEIGTRGVSVKTMNSVKDRDIWIKEYNKLKESCLKNHLII